MRIAHIRNSVTFLILLAILVAALLGAVIMPSAYALMRLRNDIVGLRTSLAQQYERTRYFRKVATSLTAIRNDTKRIRALFVTQGEEIHFITTLEGIARARGVELTIDVLGDANQLAGAPWLRAFPLRFILRGELPRVTQTIDDIERGRYFIAMHEVALQDASPSASAGTVIATIDARAYLSAP